MKLVNVSRRKALHKLAAAATGTTAAVVRLPTTHATRPAPTAEGDSQAGVLPSVLRPPTDPDLREPVVPWAKTLTAAELHTLAAICDVILPADERSPAASAVGVPDFVNEWVSAPYPTQTEDRQLIRGGLSWLNTESIKRFGKPFADLPSASKNKIADDICFVPKAKSLHRPGALFFDKLRTLCMGGFYTTDEGMTDIQYVGNAPAASFDGPPRAVLAHLKLKA